MWQQAQGSRFGMHPRVWKQKDLMFRKKNLREDVAVSAFCCWCDTSLISEQQRSTQEQAGRLGLSQDRAAEANTGHCRLPRQSRSKNPPFLLSTKRSPPCRGTPSSATCHRMSHAQERRNLRPVLASGRQHQETSIRCLVLKLSSQGQMNGPPTHSDFPLRRVRLPRVVLCSFKQEAEGELQLSH